MVCEDRQYLGEIQLFENLEPEKKKYVLSNAYYQ